MGETGKPATETRRERAQGRVAAIVMGALLVTSAAAGAIVLVDNLDDAGACGSGYGGYGSGYCPPPTTVPPTTTEPPTTTTTVPPTTTTTIPAPPTPTDVTLPPQATLPPQVSLPEPTRPPQAPPQPTRPNRP